MASWAEYDFEQEKSDIIIMTQNSLAYMKYSISWNEPRLP